MPDKSKMSKRKHETAVKRYRDMGIQPQAILNYLALLGWTPPSGKELLSLEEMITEFDLKDLHKSGAVFDMEKLRWFNREYLLKMREDDFEASAIERLRSALSSREVTWNEAIAKKIMPLVRERVSVWEDIDELSREGEFDFFFSDPQLVVSDIPQKKVSAGDTIRHLESAAQLLETISDNDFSDPEKIKAAIWSYAEQEGRGNVLWPLRYSLSGRAKSPDPFLIASLIGKETALRRIGIAIELLKGSQQ